MRIDLIKRATGGGSHDFKQSRGHLNGLLIALTQTPSDDSVITVKRRTPGETYVLANGANLKSLARISDIERGFSPTAGKHWTTLFGRLVAAGVAWNDAASDAFYDALGQGTMTLFYVDFGSLYLGGDNELDVSMNIDTDVDSDMKIGVYAVSFQRRPDFMKQYDVCLDFDAVHSMVDAVYYCDQSEVGRPLVSVATATGVVDESAVTFQVKNEGDSDVGIFDALGIVAATQVFGAVEGLTDQQCVTVFRRPDPLPCNVHVKVQNVAPASGTRFLIAVKLLYDLFSVSQNTISEAENLALRIGKLEQTHPQIAQALRHSGAIVRSETLASTVSSIKAS